MVYVIDRLNKSYWHLVYRLQRSIRESIAYTLPYMPLLALVGLIGFPLYYTIWSVWFPQPYENITVRVIGMLLCIGLLITPLWPARFQPVYALFWVVAMTYCLPFFYTFMLLNNGANLVWAMSCMAGLTILILVTHDWILTVFMFVLGASTACLVYWWQMDWVFNVPDGFWYQLVIYLFVVVTGSLFNYRITRLNQERIMLLASVGTNIAHELRNPLATIANHTNGIANYLPDLIQHYKTSHHDCADLQAGKRLRPRQLAALQNSVDNIQDELAHANTFIDMLLMNVGKGHYGVDGFDCFSMLRIINTALERFPFTSDIDRARVRVDVKQDFYFWGSDILMTHVIFNLLKNALKVIHDHNCGDIVIQVSQQGDQNILRVMDTSVGVPPSELPAIFDRFYTTQRFSQGNGIGLAFCKSVMQRFHGRISCLSTLNEGTTFTLTFPAVDHPQTSELGHCHV